LLKISYFSSIIQKGYYAKPETKLTMEDYGRRICHQGNKHEKSKFLIGEPSSKFEKYNKL